MVEKIQTTQGVVFPGGISISETKETPVEAYDKIDVVVKKQTSDGTPVQIQPGGSEQVKFLLIKSDKYNDFVSYSVGSPEPDEKKRIKLDWLQLFQGSGMLGLLPTAPNTLYFYNKSDQDLNVEVLVGRSAVASAATNPALGSSFSSSSPASKPSTDSEPASKSKSATEKV